LRSFTGTDSSTSEEKLLKQLDFAVTLNHRAEAAVLMRGKRFCIRLVMDAVFPGLEKFVKISAIRVMDFPLVAGELAWHAALISGNIAETD